MAVLRGASDPTVIAGCLTLVLIASIFLVLTPRADTMFLVIAAAGLGCSLVFPILTAVMAADNFGISFAGVALVTYMSSLTSFGYTATQYALLSSTYAYVGKFAKGFSGVIVERLAVGRTLLEGYALFFIGAGLVGIPALVLCLFLARAVWHRAEERRTAESAG